MTKSIQDALLDLKARQEAGEHMPCPRCGRDTMKPHLQTNALSRHAKDIYICDECGTSEAMLDFMNNPLPIESWALFQEKQHSSELNSLPGKEVWKQIQMDHGPILISLFKRWCEEKPGADFRAYRTEAFRKCPGLTEIWGKPFQAKYNVADGELILRFRKSDEGVEMVADLLSK